MKNQDVFPTEPGTYPDRSGITLLDYFAGKIIAEQIKQNAATNEQMDLIMVKYSYKIAALMLKERKNYIK